LRHWTRERLLIPLGEQNPGTGRHLTFADTAVLEAVILDALTDRGIPIPTQRIVMNTLRAERQQGDLTRRMKKGPDLLLLIETYPWRSQVYFHDGMYTTNEHAESVLVFNLTKLIAATGGQNV
jgi:hypothetical protein